MIKIASIIAVLIIGSILAININGQIATAMDNGLPIYTEQSIKNYDGNDLNKPVLIAYDGYVYDVTPGREEFYNVGKDYHYLAGRDSTNELNIVGGSIIQKKYKIVGVLK